jgi:hypothetical protein
MKRNISDSICVIKNRADAKEVLCNCLLWNNRQTEEIADDSDLMHSTAYVLLANLFGFRLENGCLIQKNSASVRTVFLEGYYVDKEYRDSYYLYYSRKHSQYNRFSLRVSVFDGNIKNSILNYDIKRLNSCFIGCCVVRPLKIGTIGRTLVSPRYLLEEANESGKKYLIRTTEYSVSPFGVPLHIEAFPYMMQNNETVTCAEVTLLNMLDYFSAQYNDYRYILPSDIHDAITQFSFERLLPSNGLHYEMLTKVLSTQGFAPKLYMSKQLHSTWDIRRLLSRYVES